LMAVPPRSTPATTSTGLSSSLDVYAAQLSRIGATGPLGPEFEGGRNLDVEIFADAETPMVGDQKADPPTYAA
jgi:hypothetical protein